MFVQVERSETRLQLPFNPWKQKLSDREDFNAISVGIKRFETNIPLRSSTFFDGEIQFPDGLFVFNF